MVIQQVREGDGFEKKGQMTGTMETTTAIPTQEASERRPGVFLLLVLRRNASRSSDRLIWEIGERSQMKISEKAGRAQKVSLHEALQEKKGL